MTTTTIKIKCTCDGGNLSYDNNEGFAVETPHADCNGTGFIEVQAIDFEEAKKAFEGLGELVYDEKFCADGSQPFELVREYASLIADCRIKDVAKTLGLKSDYYLRDNLTAFYFYQ